MLYRKCNVHATSMTSCDDVIDQVIIQILALNFCDFHPQNRQIRHKFVANKDLEFKRKQLGLCLMHFQSFQVKKHLNLAPKNFRLFSLSKGMQNTRLNH